MRIRLLTIVVCAALTGLGTSAAQGQQAGDPDSCKLLASSLQGGLFYKHLVRLDPGGYWAACHYSDGKGLNSQWYEGFGLLPEPSVVAAKKSWQVKWNAWRGKTGNDFTVERLRGFGADDAFGVENRLTDPPRTDTLIWWRKGHYDGQLELRAPGLVADLDDAAGILKVLMRGIPGS